MKRLIAVYDDSMFMFADKDANELKQEDKCVVYNADTEEFAPELCIGSWTARMSPWDKPTARQYEKAGKLIDLIPQEINDV